MPNASTGGLHLNFVAGAIVIGRIAVVVLLRLVGRQWLPAVMVLRWCSDVQRLASTFRSGPAKNATHGG